MFSNFGQVLTHFGQVLTSNNFRLTLGKFEQLLIDFRTSACPKALEITRLNITMQSLIQSILSQIIDSCFYFPERFCDFS